VYFEQDTLEFASGLCEKAGELFGLKVGRVHQKPVGPYPNQFLMPRTFFSVGD